MPGSYKEGEDRVYIFSNCNETLKLIFHAAKAISFDSMSYPSTLLSRESITVVNPSYVNFDAIIRGTK